MTKDLIATLNIQVPYIWDLLFRIIFPCMFQVVACGTITKIDEDIDGLFIICFNLLSPFLIIIIASMTQLLLFVFNEATDPYAVPKSMGIFQQVLDFQFYCL
jgi:hypothetical protein